MTTIHQQKTGLVTPLTPTLALTLAITLDPDPDPNPNPNSNQSPLGTISHLTRTYGTACLWRGVVPTAWREAIYTAGYLPCRKQARCGHKLSRRGRTALSRTTKVADWPRLAGPPGPPRACSGAESSLRSASWPKAEPAWFRHRLPGLSSSDLRQAHASERLGGELLRVGCPQLLRRWRHRQRGHPIRPHVESSSSR